MAEITANAYQDLRDYVEATWIYIALYDNQASPVEIVRIPVSDSRVSWTHNVGAQTLELTCTVRGDDGGFTLPKTFAGSKLYKVSSGGTPMSEETFATFTMQTEEDQLTVRHRIELPELI